MEFLKDILGEELYAQVAEKLNGNDKVRLANVADGSYVPKDKFDAERSAGKGYKAQIDELNTKLTAMQQQAGDADALKTQIAQLQANIAERDAAMQKQALEYRVKDEIRSSRAKNADVVLRMIDRDKLAINDDKLTGLAEQIEALKKSDGYLFEDEHPKNGGLDPHQEPGTAKTTNADVNRAIRAAVGRS